MEISRIHKITFSKEETIITATVSSLDEIVMLMCSGKVIRYNIKDQKSHYLFSVKSNSTFTDGGFDINARSTIYTLDSIVVIVNDYKLHGIIYYPKKYKSLRFSRNDYHANISCYPIALFKDKEDVPHLIYGEAWNHIQVMNLDTRQILTASKSLIEENAEERHLEFYKNYKEDTKLSWPRPYDYFFGKLSMSPDNKHFLSAGWAWGSSDVYNVYEVDHFINSNRIAAIEIDGWEHSNRGVCWIDNRTVAITYNPLEEDDEGATKDAHNEIHFYKLEEGTFKKHKKIKVIGLDILTCQMYFNKDLNAMVLLTSKSGIVMVSLEGDLLLHDQKNEIDTYNSHFNLFVKVDGTSVTLYQVKTK